MKAFVVALLAAGCLLALPGLAGAATFTVNSTGDGPDNGAPNGDCETTTADECTLRAAIQESNATAAVKDNILFDLSVFQGQLADTIAPGAALPAITSPVAINGATCLTAAGVNGPCAAINGPSGGIGLEVTADETSISRLSITGTSFGIGVFLASTDFSARGNWIGVKLDGSAGGNGNAGIFIDPNSDDATIGGTEAAQRNVISNTTGVGLDLEGASEATIQGNYFGVSLDGTSQMSNGKNIEITGRVGASPSEDVEAEDNEIGAAIEGAALTSDTCDGGCNVISGAGTGIDLNGLSAQSEKPAAGPTTIQGNFVGLDAAGTTAIPNTGVGIWAGGADHVTVGAQSVFSPLLPAANHIVGGSEAIVSEIGGDDFEARGNSIGFGSDGSDLTPPLEKGIIAIALAVSEEPEIENNDVRMVGGVGIEVRFLTGRITGNDIEGGGRGIRVGVEPGEGLIASNTIEAATEYGILVESPDTEVRNNDIFDSGAAGIRVVNPLGGVKVNGSRIGGDTAESENLIEGSGGDAIEILEEAGEPGSTTEIGRNRGSGNAGQFIDLVAGANEGIVSPPFTSAIQSKAEGTAEPDATVRVFRKASAEPGELQSFLAETVADGSGKWSVTYPQVPTGSVLAATQTGETGGTSELATTTAAADPSNGGGGGGGDGKAGKDGGGAGEKCKPTKPKKCPGDPVDEAPQTKITKGPKGKVATTTVKFKFSSSEKGSSFRCKLDKKPYRVCKSPKTYRNLKPGKHVFKVRAVDKAGNIDPSAAKRAFRITP